MGERTILIVEDDADINALLAKIVAREGFGCVQAYSGTEALLQMERAAFDLVLLDMMQRFGARRAGSRGVADGHERDEPQQQPFRRHAPSEHEEQSARAHAQRVGGDEIAGVGHADAQPRSRRGQDAHHHEFGEPERERSGGKGEQAFIHRMDGSFGTGSIGLRREERSLPRGFLAKPA